jgi:hypothetical protein
MMTTISYSSPFKEIGDGEDRVIEAKTTKVLGSQNVRSSSFLPPTLIILSLLSFFSLFLQQMIS